MIHLIVCREKFYSKRTAMEIREKPISVTANRTIELSMGRALISHSGTMIALCLLAVIAVQREVPVFWPLGVLLILTVMAIAVGNHPVLHPAIFCTLLVSCHFFCPSHFRVWPFKLLLPLCIYGALVLSSSGLRRSVTWMQTGRITVKTVLIILATTLVSSVALVVWYLLFKPEMSCYTGQILSMPLWILPFAGIGFAVMNAAMEEIAFRGIIMEALENALGPGVASLILQAILFGLVHYLSGFPCGVCGVLMASVYGVMLGWLRRLSRGLLVPWMAHVFADITIFAIISSFILYRQCAV